MFFRMHKSILFIITTITIAVLAYFIFIHKDATKQNNIVYTVKRQNIVNKITEAGTIVPKRETVVAAPYAGYIKKIYVSLGQPVNKLDPLVSITKSLQSSEKSFPILAPYAGKVVFINKSEGEYVNQSTSSSQDSDFILKVDDLSQIYVSANITENNISKIKKGQKVSIKLSASSNEKYNGIVESVSLSPAPSQESNFGQKQVNYPVKILITNKETNLLPGMSVLCEFFIAEKKNVISVPNQYIRFIKGESYVLLDNRKMQQVTLGIQTTQDAEVTKGLQVGDKIEPIDYFKQLGDQ